MTAQMKFGFVIRVWRTLKQMKADGVTGNTQSVLAELLRRLQAETPEEIDWETILALIMEYLPLLLALIEMLFAL